MYKRILVSFGIVGVLVVSGIAFARPVSALSVGDIQSQIQTLLARIADFNTQAQAQSSSSVSVGDSSVSSSPVQYRVCGMLNRNLSRGAQGEDVSSLQEFLQSEGYLSAGATGYYGALTAQAVAQWQAKEGVSAVGSVGPISRERIKMRCGGWNNSQRFSATSQSGTAPLTVTFYTNISGFHLASEQYTIEFGDGSSERAADCNAPADACISPGQNRHTYTSNGTYTALLVHTSDPCGGNPMCMAPISREVIAKLQINVGQQACTKEYIPVCGMKQVVCIAAPCNPVPQTYSNRCMMRADGATFAYDGVCRSTADKAPVISGLSGPTSLSVGATGTWTVNASDPENGQLTYQVWWGDENVYAPAMSTAAAAREFVQTTTFTHSYANAGTYTVVVVVRDAAGNEAKTSTTVRVGEGPVACTMEYAPVCGRPTGCANTCPPGMYCTMMCRLYDPVTYSNRCMLNAAGAEFLYNGSCNGSSVY